MSDLISRDAVLAEIDRWKGYLDDDMIQRIQIGINRITGLLPPADSDLSEYSDKLWRNAYERGKADAKVRKTGKWIMIPNGLLYYKSFECSECGMQIVKGNPDNYCPRCGAKMEVQDEEH